MHAADLAELASVLAMHGRAFAEAPATARPSVGEEYWLASKTRADLWYGALKEYRQRIGRAFAKDRPAAWRAVQPIVEEVLVSEVLTRIYAAVAAGRDRLQRRLDFSPVARSVFASHLEARNRALNLMVYGQGFQVREAILLNQVRRRAERWTDLLLGYFVEPEDAAGLGFDAARVGDFAEDAAEDRRRGGANLSQALLLASLRGAFGEPAAAAAPQGELNRRIAAGALRILPPEQFDSTGLPKSLWAVRMENQAGDVQFLVDELLADPDGLNSPRPSAVRADISPWLGRG